MELLGEGLFGTIVNNNAGTGSKQDGSARPKSDTHLLPWYTPLQATNTIPWRGANYGARVNAECSEALFPKLTLPQPDPSPQRPINEVETGEPARVSNPCQDPCIQVREKMRMAPFRRELVGGKLHIMPEKNAANVPRTASGEERKLPNGLPIEWLDKAPKNLDQNAPNIFCCPNQLGFREDKDGRPNTPPVGRSAQLSTFMDNMIDRSDNRWFIKENLTYPPYFVKCSSLERSETEPAPKNENKSVLDSISKDCPKLHLKPTVDLGPVKTSQQLVDDDIADNVTTLHNIKLERSKLYKHLADLEKSLHGVKEELYSIPHTERSQRSSFLASQADELQRQIREVSMELNRLNREMMDLRVIGHDLEDGLTKIILDKEAEIMQELGRRQ